ncbi:unnamed protein product [Didymodactylos carnosus]|uniref:Uncharacterized protein n=1 Tax=Didymodactylos carnosus TaxID=1234261 RepID=A0A813ZB00_9BILA|nr:unnamed protein product [Didymodactylos carnosus]CAF0896135.1 unnamed protein product [Didymodactylos carnosus]CAF3677570.1 unnamed protein product [Didymodactylos carnosus]CAF3679101.1 unnamed protein product [Didymodactylos carnosus]
MALKIHYRCFYLCIVFSILLNETYSKSVYPHAHGQRLSISRYPHTKDRMLRSILGKLLNVDTNVIYTPGNDIPPIEQESSTILPQTLFDFKAQHTCVTACYACLGGPSSLEESNIKRSSDENCGPMCDCADMCFTTSLKEVNLQYGGEKSCWLRSYLQAISDEPVM